MITRRDMFKRIGAVALVPIIGIKPIVSPEEYTAERLLSAGNAVLPSDLKEGDVFVMLRHKDETISMGGFATSFVISQETAAIDVSPPYARNSSFVAGRTSISADISIAVRGDQYRING